MSLIATDSLKLEAIRNLFYKHVDPAVLNAYRLPQFDKKVTLVVGLSGGADSSVLGLLVAAFLGQYYSNIVYLFTDTKAEPESCYDTLDRFEEMTGAYVTRLVPEKGLYELIDNYNGYLPSVKSRYCTSTLKVTPLEEFIKLFGDDVDVISLAGIRYDEMEREGIKFQYSMENANAVFPFIDLKITREMVFDILHNSIGIPATYAYRSRSGCSCCFFQRNQELIGMLFSEPKEFAKMESKEKLSIEDQSRWPTPDVSPQRFRLYPVPEFIDIRFPEALPKPMPKQPKKAKVAPIDDLFPETKEKKKTSVFVAYALYVHPMLGLYGNHEFTPGTYHQEFITVSTSSAGIKSALGNYYKFRMTTPMPTADLDHLQIVIAQVDFDEDKIDTKPPAKESFTWKSGVALAQLKHLAIHCGASLEAHDIKRRYKQAADLANTTSDEDVYLDAMDRLEDIILEAKTLKAKGFSSFGKVVWEGIYTPSKPVAEVVQMQLAGMTVDAEFEQESHGLEYDRVAMSCIACSI